MAPRKRKNWRIKTNSNKSISLIHTVLSHGWINLAPWIWDNDRCVLCREEMLSHKKCRVEVSQIKPDEFHVSVKSSNEITISKIEINTIVGRWLSLKWDPSEAITVAIKLSPDIAKFIKMGGGRFLRCTTFYEDFVKTICTMNVSWAFTKRAAYRFVEDLGAGTFPSPMQVIQAGQGFLETEIRLGYRSKILYQATEWLLDSGLMDQNGNADEKNIRYEDLISMKGIGPYAASHLMFLLHDFSRIPMDTEVTKYCFEKMGISKDQIIEHFSSWGRYSFLGYKIGRIISKTNWIG